MKSIYPGGVRGYCREVFTGVVFVLLVQEFDPQEPDVLSIKTHGAMNNQKVHARVHCIS